MDLGTQPHDFSFLVVASGKEPPIQETEVRDKVLSLGQKDPLE